MSLLKKGTSAIGKLFAIAFLAGAFLVGLVGVVYMSLQGEELTVPEVVGKDFVESEKELAQLGLKIKRRADRYSKEKQNTILEQRPKPGEVVKTGQMILVVVSKENPDGEEAPATIETNEDEKDIEKIEELISDKPKPKSKKASNADKKKSTKTRDIKVEKKETDGDSDAGKDADVADKSGDSKTDNPTAVGDKPKTETPAKTDGDKKPADKPKTPKAEPPPVPKPKVEKPKSSGETRPRTTP